MEENVKDVKKEGEKGRKKEFRYVHAVLEAQVSEIQRNI